MNGIPEHLCTWLQWYGYDRRRRSLANGVVAPLLSASLPSEWQEVADLYVRERGWECVMCMMSHLYHHVGNTMSQVELVEVVGEAFRLFDRVET